MSANPAAVRLEPSLRQKVWGRKRLQPWFPDASAPVGEAWYLDPRDADPPLLIKLIFTSERLSVQVHPEDGEAGPRGKSEMWYILEAEPGASIALGFREPLERSHIAAAARTGEIERLLNWMPVKSGETYYTPAHTVHAIGAGLVLCEIQQNSDVTYRLFDYGRPRPLHVEQAVPIADLGVHPGAVRPIALGEECQELVRSRHFITEAVRLRAGTEHTPEYAPSQLWFVVEGEGSIGAEPFRAGEVWRLAETGGQPVIHAATAARFLRTRTPG